MNFLLAFILFATLALTQGVPDATKPGALINAIVPGSPAEMAGLQLGDRIVAVNGQSVTSTLELQDLTKASLGMLTTYALVRVDPNTGVAQNVEVTMTPTAPTRRRARVRWASQLGKRFAGRKPGRPYRRARTPSARSST